MDCFDADTAVASILLRDGAAAWDVLAIAAALEAAGAVEATTTEVSLEGAVFGVESAFGVEVAGSWHVSDSGARAELSCHELALHLVQTQLWSR